MKVKRGWAFVDDVAGVPSAFLKDVPKDIPVFDGDKQPLPDLTKDIPTFETDSVSEYDSKGNFIGGKKCQRYLRIFPS